MLWLKAFHIIFVVTWFAGLFYLPRLFIYHALANDAVSIARFKIMEHKLIKIIMTPSAALATAFGAAMIALNWTYYSHQHWLWAKLALVTCLLGYHAYAVFIARTLANDGTPHSARFYRIFNELPALVLISVVILVVVKPF